MPHRATFSELLRDAMSRDGYKPSTLAKRLGVTRQTVYKWLEGQLPKHSHAQALQSLLGVPVYPNANVTIVPLGGGRRVPLIEGDIANAGSGSLVASSVNIEEPEVWLDVDFPVSPGTVALRIRGNSMEPEFYDGELVVVDPGITPQSGDFVIAEVEEQWTFKQYRHRGHHDGMVIFDLVALNPLFRTITVGPDHPGRVVGTMVEHRVRPTFRRR